jgi:hypothetical protein
MFGRKHIAAALVLGSIGLATFASVSGDALPTRRTPFAKQLPPGEALTIIEAKCLLCHSSMLVAQQHKDSLGWEKTVTLMENWGARLVPADHQVVVGYLLANFGPKPAK